MAEILFVNGVGGVAADIATAGTYTPVITAPDITVEAAPLGVWRWQKIASVTTPGTYIVQVFGTLQATNEQAGPDIFALYFTLPAEAQPVGGVFAGVFDLSGSVTMLETLSDPAIVDRASACMARIAEARGTTVLWMSTPGVGGTCVWGISFAYSAG